jgi:hypothetical protein
MMSRISQVQDKTEASIARASGQLDQTLQVGQGERACVRAVLEPWRHSCVARVMGVAR